MDLLSLDGIERYHTLAALMEIGGEEHEEFLLSGLVPDDRRDRISRIMHEVTHVASIRTTRLGFWISRVASETLGGQRRVPNAELVVAPTVEALLGAFAPLLEGLALYGQLDYELAYTDDVLPFPLNKIATNNTGDALLPEGDLRAMRLAKATTIWEGTLAALFLDVIPQTEHYLAGYLYIKAVVAKLARFQPCFADPSIALPVLVRLICDHPILEGVRDSPNLAHTVIESLLCSLHELSEVKVRRIAQMIMRRDVREAFDNWDIYKQLAKTEDHPLVTHTSENPIFDGMGANQLFKELRGATSVHLTSWTAGLAAELEFEGGQARLKLVDGPRCRTVKILVYSVLRSVLRNIDLRSKVALEKFEELFFLNLSEACRRNSPVVVGSYLTLTRGGAGMVLWVDDELRGIIPLSLLDSRLDPDEVCVAKSGLKLSPMFRRQFAHALRATDAQATARGETNDAIMAALVSDPMWRTVVLRCGLSSVLPPRLRSSLREWCCESLGPRGDDQLSAEVRADLARIFDRPALGGGPFDDMIPDLVPLGNFLRSQR